MKDYLKKFVVSGALQPILTVVLVVLLIFMIFQYFGNNNADKTGVVEKEIGKSVDFETATQRFYSSKYNVYTRGSLFVKEQASTSLSPATTTPTPSVTTIPLVENKYDDMIFLVDEGNVRKLDIKAYGKNESLFINSKGEIVYLSTTNRQYTLYPLPADSETTAIKLFEGTKSVLQNTFPLIPLLQDYKDGKFNPILRAENVYSGQWKNALYTNDEVAEVVLQTDPLSGVFKSFNVTNTNPPSQITFEFTERTSIANYDTIPTEFASVEVPNKYKTK